MGTKKHFKVGDWVKSDRTGIQRVESIIPLEYEEYHYFVGEIDEDQIGKPAPSLVILKRLFNVNFNKQKGAVHGEISSLKPLSKEEQTRMAKKVAESPDILTEFDNYKMADFDTRIGVDMYLLDRELHVLSELAAFVRDGGKTFTDIFAWLDENSYRKYLVPDPEEEEPVGNFVQLINYNFETRNKRMLFKEVYAFTPTYAKIEL